MGEALSCYGSKLYHAIEENCVVYVGRLSHAIEQGFSNFLFCNPVLEKKFLCDP